MHEGADAGPRFMGVMAVSADGTITVGGMSNISKAFISDQSDSTHGMKGLRGVLLEAGLGLELEAWTIKGADGISSDGRTIVGYGVNLDGKTEAWMATIPKAVPVPTLSRRASLALVLPVVVESSSLLALGVGSRVHGTG